MRVALFAQWDFEAPGGLRTTTAGLVDRSPNDIHVVPYLNHSGASSLLRVNELIARVQQQRIDIVHLASYGHIALAALLVAAKLHLPLVGSFNVDSLTTTALRPGISGRCPRCATRSSCRRRARTTCWVA